VVRPAKTAVIFSFFLRFVAR